jgi:hypothetical protein
MSSTVMRVPLITGFPIITAGFETINPFGILILLLIHESILGSFSKFYKICPGVVNTICSVSKVLMDE